MAGVEAADDATVVVTLTGNQLPDTILTIAGLPILSAAFYEGRNFTASSLDPPLGSGAYRVGSLSPGRYIEYERVPDYWAADLNVNVGQNNFDIIRIDFFRERQAAFEAFKKGDITFREEFTSITWAQGYDFPAIAEGRAKKAEFPQEASPSMQGWFLNTRKPKFADPRTRMALDYAFDFEWTNKNLFFGIYSRIASYFQKSEFMAEGLPSADELALLEPFRDSLPAEAFAEPYVPPVSDGSGSDRTLLRRASELLTEAGWTQDSGGLVNAAGERLEIEFLIEAEVFVRVLTPYTENLRRIGIDATIRQVDPSQYQSRLNTYDYDIVGAAFSMSATPLDGLGQFFATRSAEANGTYNLAGIRVPAMDALLERLQAVQSRAELVTVVRAMDRVLRAGHYWVSNWFSEFHRVAHWDIFGWPPEKPDYGFPAETLWWFDRDKAAAIGMAG
jgi:microcin C transport system substrate-binding protein